MIGHFISSLYVSLEYILDCLDQQFLLKILLGMDDLETGIDYNVVRNGTCTILFVNSSIRVDDHRVSQSMLGRPRRCLFPVLLDANGKNFESFVFESLPDLFFDYRSLLLATCSECFPEN